MYLFGKIFNKNIQKRYDIIIKKNIIAIVIHYYKYAKIYFL